HSRSDYRYRLRSGLELLALFSALLLSGTLLHLSERFFLHYGGNPDKPIAWGVSSYAKWYNLLWFNNGYHAEHHFRPKVHWTKMKQLHTEIAEAQLREGSELSDPRMRSDSSIPIFLHCQWQPKRALSVRLLSLLRKMFRLSYNTDVDIDCTSG